MIRNLCALAPMFLVGLALLAPTASGQVEKAKAKKKEAKKEAELPVERLANIDDGQIEKLDLIEKAFRKLYGAEVELDAADNERLQFVVYQSLNGTHMPERDKTNKLTAEMVGVLKGRKLTAADAYQVMYETASALAENQVSKELYDGFTAEIQEIIGLSNMPEEEQPKMVLLLQEILKTAKVNDSKIKAREEEKKKADEKAEKERKKKLDEIKKKLERKSKSSGEGNSRSGSSEYSR